MVRNVGRLAIPVGIALGMSFDQGRVVSVRLVSRIDASAFNTKPIWRRLNANPWEERDR
jgi:hypothetical protein